MVMLDPEPEGWEEPGADQLYVPLPPEAVKVICCPMMAEVLAGLQTTFVGLGGSGSDPPQFAEFMSLDRVLSEMVCPEELEAMTR